jgi:transglutaminase-like putative cysteine protease
MAACASTGELSWAVAYIAMALATLGMGFSYQTRTHPPWWVKVVVAIGAIAASARFFHAVLIPDAGVISIEGPLTVLLASVLVLHSFHIPARRDLMFSLGASSALMAVAGSQAIDLKFGLYVLAWFGFGLWALTETWTSASGGSAGSLIGLGAAFVAVVTAACAVFLLLPAPNVAARLAFLAKAGFGGAVNEPGALAGDSGSPTQLAEAGTPGGPTRVGGYLGFATSLDTALRGQLGDALVMRVRAQRPSYWVGETFNTWNGQSWVQKQPVGSTEPLTQKSPIDLPLAQGDIPIGQSDLQTFYVATSTADLIFHTEGASELWFPRSTIYFSADGTMVSPIGLGHGSVYTVESQVPAATPNQLKNDSDREVPLDFEHSNLQLPHSYPRVQKLAEQVTQGDSDTYDKVQSLITWMGTHTRYSTQIPPLPSGADTVEEFLFGDRVGFCEQISTSLAVMLRSLGIPAREAVGYVPGSYDPITDLYQVDANDAHAWVQVWFPGYGWQDFDPTASVLPINPSPGFTALKDVSVAFEHIPPVPVISVAVAIVLWVIVWRTRRFRRLTWAEKAARRLEHVGRRAGRPRRPAESLVEYAGILDDVTADQSVGWTHVATEIEMYAYGHRKPSKDRQRDLLAQIKRHTSADVDIR